MVYNLPGMNGLTRMPAGVQPVLNPRHGEWISPTQQAGSAHLDTPSTQWHVPGMTGPHWLSNIMLAVTGSPSHFTYTRLTNIPSIWTYSGTVCSIYGRRNEGDLPGCHPVYNLFRTHDTVNGSDRPSSLAQHQHTWIPHPRNDTTLEGRVHIDCRRSCLQLLGLRCISPIPEVNRNVLLNILLYMYHIRVLYVVYVLIYRKQNNNDLQGCHLVCNLSLIHYMVNGSHRPNSQQQY